MKKLTLVSDSSSLAGRKKPGVARGLVASALVLVMVLALYVLAHWALTDTDPIVRGLAALGFMACTAATAIGLRKRFRSAN